MRLWLHLSAGEAGGGVGAEDAVGNGGRALALRCIVGVQGVRLAADLQGLARQRGQLVCDLHQRPHNARLAAQRVLIPGGAIWAGHNHSVNPGT